MASVQKFNNNAMSNMLRHNRRETVRPSNKDIDKSRSFLNYSFPMDHNGLSAFDYYKKLRDENYLYGRGTKREDKAITGCGWIVTLPRELSGNYQKEKTFFEGVFDFVSHRYGKENILDNAVHYDEVGQPHIHIIFCPVTDLDHDIVRNKTTRTSNTVRLDSGRIEFAYRFKVDAQGKKIPLKNYAKSTDDYDKKIDANTVLNKAELKSFHLDLQKYLTLHGIEGSVVTGKTGGVNFSVQELKEFTEKTGLHLEDIREIQADKSLLESLVIADEKSNILEHSLSEKKIALEALEEYLLDKNRDLSSKDEQIKTLLHEMQSKDMEIDRINNHNKELEIRVAELEKLLVTKQADLDRAHERIEALEHERTITTVEQDRSWGKSSEGWGERATSGWGTKSKILEEEKIW